MHISDFVFFTYTCMFSQHGVWITLAWAIIPKFGATVSIVSSIFLARDVIIKWQEKKSATLTNDEQDALRNIDTSLVHSLVFS